MSLTSLHFFIFLLVTLILYYILKPAQKYVLLTASIFFYISISNVNVLKLTAVMAYIILVTYIGALAIDRAGSKAKKTFLGVSIIALVSALALLKYAFNILSVINALIHVSKDFSWLKFAAVIGISYYTLSAIGYLIDVYWGVYKAEKNIVDVALFIFYFPQLISGPFTRFASMHQQFNRKISADYSGMTLGMRRMVWGYFKKLVISERFGVVVSSVYGDYTSYSGIGIIGATLCYAVQLYTDFSGCMDIIMGASMLFGIELPENFKAPFFSESIQEFWQRWHITLGTWCKDYIMYPLQKSGGIQKIGKWFRKKFGKNAGKKIPFYLSMSVLWILIGIWHGGTGYYFIASAVIPCTLLSLSGLCQPLFIKLVKRLHIDTECESWRWIKRIRTLLLICICWIFVCAGGTHSAIKVFHQMFTCMWNYATVSASFDAWGLTVSDALIMGWGIVILYVSDLYIYRGTSLFKKLDEQNFFIKIMVIYAEVLMIMLHGMVGSSAFIYFQF